MYFIPSVHERAMRLPFLGIRTALVGGTPQVTNPERAR
jgi:hypothetical protein